MKIDIFMVQADLKYKTFGLKEGENSYLNFTGQSLKNEWKILIFERMEDLLKNKLEIKQEKNKRDDFDALLMYNSLFILKNNISYIFNNLNYLEILPIKLNNNDTYSYINIMNVIEAINFYGMDYKQSMEMLRNNKIKFILKTR
jgi:hypothetical protein